MSLWKQYKMTYVWEKMLNIKVGETFVRGKEKYRLAEKKELEELVEKYKKECDKEVKTLQGKTHYDYERKKHVPIKPTQGFQLFERFSAGISCSRGL